MANPQPRFDRRSSYPPPPSLLQAHANAEPSLGAEETVSERASVPKEWALDLAGEEGEKDEPISNFSVRSICDPHDLRRRSVSAEAEGNTGQSALLKSALQERSVRIERRTQCEQSAPSRHDRVCFALRKAALSVSPPLMKRVQGGTHSLKRYLSDSCLPVAIMII